MRAIGLTQHLTSANMINNPTFENMEGIYEDVQVPAAITPFPGNTYDVLMPAFGLLN